MSAQPATSCMEAGCGSQYFQFMSSAGDDPVAVCAEQCGYMYPYPTPYCGYWQTEDIYPNVICCCTNIPP